MKPVILLDLHLTWTELLLIDQISKTWTLPQKIGDFLSFLHFVWREIMVTIKPWAYGLQTKRVRHLYQLKEDKVSRINDSTTRTALVAISAGLIGASIALLLAPQSGRKTRRKLRRAGQDIARRGELFCEDLNDNIREFMEDLEEFGNRGIDKGREAGTRIYSEVIDSLEAGGEAISRQIDRLRHRAGR